MNRIIDLSQHKLLIETYFKNKEIILWLIAKPTFLHKCTVVHHLQDKYIHSYDPYQINTVSMYYSDREYHLRKIQWKGKDQEESVEATTICGKEAEDVLKCAETIPGRICEQLVALWDLGMKVALYTLYADLMFYHSTYYFFKQIKMASNCYLRHVVRVIKTAAYRAASHTALDLSSRSPTRLQTSGTQTQSPIAKVSKTEKASGLGCSFNITNPQVTGSCRPW